MEMEKESVSFLTGFSTGILVLSIIFGTWIGFLVGLDLLLLSGILDQLNDE